MLFARRNPDSKAVETDKKLGCASTRKYASIGTGILASKPTFLRQNFSNLRGSPQLGHAARKTESLIRGALRKGSGRSISGPAHAAPQAKDADGVLANIKIDACQPIVPQIYRELRRAIIDNRLASGMQIREEQAARLLGISRTPLRGAFQQLVAEGLIVTRPQVGSVVAPLDQARVEEAVHIRSALEIAIVRRLAETGMSRARFAQNLAAQQVAAEMDDYMTFFRFDEEFHAGLAEMSRMPNAWGLIQSVKAHVDRQRLILMSSVVGRSMQAYKEHLAVLAAIEAGRPDEAEQVMRKHVSSVLDTKALTSPPQVKD